MAEALGVRSGHAPVNGIRMYYEVHGTAGGPPLVLLPGGGSTLDSTFGRVIPLFARRRTVVALDEQAHGRTSDRDAPVAFTTSADDVAALLTVLGIPRADLFGFSNGASVALQVAIRHPEIVRKLIFASAMTRRDGAWPELWEFIDKADIASMPQALKDAFLAVNPDPAKLKLMHDKDARRMQTFADVPDADVHAIRAPTLVLAGDRDVVRPEHAVEVSRLIPDARLLILPAGHGDYIGEVSGTTAETPMPALTVGLIEAFLDA